MGAPARVRATRHRLPDSREHFESCESGSPTEGVPVFRTFAREEAEMNVREPLTERKRCIHGAAFPCAQCKANRSWNEAATRQKLTEPEFEARYVAKSE